MREQSVNYMIVKAGRIINYIRGFTYSHGTTVPGGSRPPHCRGFPITLRHTTLGIFPLDG